MPLIIAIEPDRKQAEAVAALARGVLRSEVIVTDSADAALAVMARRVPDLVLTSLLLPPKDEAKIADRLRALDSGGRYIQTLVIPLLASSGKRSSDSKRRLWKSKAKASAPDGCAPEVFASQISEYLRRAATEGTLGGPQEQPALHQEEMRRQEEPAVRQQERGPRQQDRAPHQHEQVAHQEEHVARQQQHAARQEEHLARQQHQQQHVPRRQEHAARQEGHLARQQHVPRQQEQVPRYQEPPSRQPDQGLYRPNQALRTDSFAAPPSDLINGRDDVPADPLRRNTVDRESIFRDAAYESETARRPDNLTDSLLRPRTESPRVAPPRTDSPRAESLVADSVISHPASRTDLQDGQGQRKPPPTSGHSPHLQQQAASIEPSPNGAWRSDAFTDEGAPLIPGAPPAETTASRPLPKSPPAPPPAPTAARPAPGTNATRPTPGTTAARSAPGIIAARSAPGTAATRPAPDSSAARTAPGIIAARSAPGIIAARSAPGTTATRPAPDGSAVRSAPGIIAARQAPSATSARQTPAASGGPAASAATANRPIPGDSGARSTPNVVAASSTNNVTGPSSRGPIVPRPSSVKPAIALPASNIPQSAPAPAAIEPAAASAERPPSADSANARESAPRPMRVLGALDLGAFVEELATAKKPEAKLESPDQSALIEPEPIQNTSTRESEPARAAAARNPVIATADPMPTQAGPHTEAVHAPAPSVAGGVRTAVAQTVSTEPASGSAASDQAHRDRAQKPRRAVQDEWGIFDPQQAGFAALFAKLEEITEQDDTPTDPPA